MKKVRLGEVKQLWFKILWAVVRNSAGDEPGAMCQHCPLCPVFVKGQVQLKPKGGGVPGRADLPKPLMTFPVFGVFFLERGQ